MLQDIEVVFVLAATDDFLRELTRIFGDSDELATAARDLERLRQGNWEFSRYFVRLVAINWFSIHRPLSRICRYVKAVNVWTEC